jgi:transposase
MIKFTPLHGGMIKLLVQQPPSDALTLDSSMYDLEIALYDLQQDKILETSKNFELQDTSFNGKLDYAVLQYQITQELLGKELYLLFRAENFSSGYEEEILGDCLDVLIELQFSSYDSMSVDKCDRNPDIQQSFRRDTVIIVDRDHPFSLQPTLNGKETLKSFSVSNNYNQFFFVQDFYLGSSGQRNNNGDELRDMEVSLITLQKFTQKNSVSFAVEIIGEDIDYQEAEKLRSTVLTGNQKPECKGVCMIGG